MKLKFNILFCIVFLFSNESSEIFADNGVQQTMPEFQLSKKLLTGFDINTRPLTNCVNLEFDIHQIISVNEKNQVLTITAILKMEWNESRLAWNTSEFNLNNILVPAKSIWTPDLYFINTADANGFVNIQSQNLALVNSNGNVYLNLEIPTLNTRCDMNIRKFPFDTQLCEIDIGFWQNDLTRLELKIAADKLDLKDYTTNPLWHLDPPKIQDEVSNLRFAGGLNGKSYKVKLELRRRNVIYILYYFFACYIMNLIILFAFFMPWAQQGQISINK
jgi:hypothetical protein